MTGRTVRRIDGEWFAQWLDAVRDGRSPMSQRQRSSIDSHGGLDIAITEARDRDIHLVELTSDKSEALIAASLHPFKTLCRPGRSLRLAAPHHSVRPDAIAGRSR